ncbi:MAG: metal ABC transporter substrate-binding protein [Oscillospiraceae bacterium]|jgi:zinc transport system substrate-binding protein|nr:metal ABC transporter substrate-binding protein [Oscillospiraceae bacterium]
MKLLNKKQCAVVFLAVFMILAVLPGCGQDAEVTPERKISIVTTIFPQYDWVREIIGEKADNFELTILVDSVVDFHSFQPSVSDIAKISASDLFIYVGGHSDDWVENALRQATNPGLTAINLVEELGDAIKIERLTEGMEHYCEDEECEDDHGEVAELHEEEHVWTSLRNTKILCEAIAEVIIKLDPANEDVYRNNLGAYIEKLAALDARYQEMADAAGGNTLVFGDRFPFLYLMDDYGINYYAAFSGCSAETEASFSTVIILARKMDEYNLGNIMVVENANRSIAETIIGNTRDKDQQILALHDFKAITSNDIRNGITYLSIMESNLEVLREALG